MKSSKLIAAVIGTVLAGGSTLSLADNDLCREIQFRITNQHPTSKPITIVAVKYLNVANNKDVTVDLARPFACEFGKTCLTRKEDLRDIEGTAMKHIRIVYSYVERDGDLSDKVVSREYEVDDKDCRADRIYGKKPLGFVIGPV